MELKLRALRNYRRSPFQLETSMTSTLNIAHSSRRLCTADLRFSFLCPIRRPSEHMWLMNTHDTQLCGNGCQTHSHIKQEILAMKYIICTRKYREVAW